MKWFIPLTIALCLGYFAGLKNQAPQQINANPQFIEACAITEDALTLSKPDEPITPQCNCEKAPSCDIRDENPLPLPTLFTQLLEDAQYSEAISFYNTVWRISETNAANLRLLLIQHIQQLSKQPSTNHPRISEAINYYLADFYDDTDMLLLLAKNQASGYLFYESISTFQLASGYAYTNNDKQKIAIEYQKFIGFIDQIFSGKQQWSTLIEHYLYAKDRDLLSDKNQFRLIELYLYNKNEFQAKAEATSLAASAQWQEKVSTLLQSHLGPSEDNQSDKNDSLDTSIALKKIANQFIVNVELSGIDTDLLIDTGASITTITKTYYQSIKSSAIMSYIDKQTFLTANGEINGEIYRLKQLKIGEHILENIDIAVLDYPSGPHASGLLGMNVLRKFQFQIDQQNSQLKLKAIDQ
ncbi:MAG: clan AA aspartic protease (TIGR02281 family) [Kiritimatiellia bacterium]|jgi:clan AA aspartic protease (TIGR02281 family)